MQEKPFRTFKECLFRKTIDSARFLRFWKPIPIMPKKPLRDHIEKPEDKIWKEWFTKLKPEDHEHYLEKLGLDQEDMEELPAIETQLHEIEGENKPVDKDLSETIGLKKKEAPVPKAIKPSKSTPTKGAKKR